MSTHYTELRFYSRILPKKAVQALLKDIRSHGDIFKVVKTNTGYEATEDGTLIFRAMNGTRNYLCRLSTSHFPHMH